MSQAFYLLWIVPHAGLAACLFLLFRRHLQRHLFSFTIYIEFKLFEFLGLFSFSILAPKFSSTPLNSYRYAAAAGLAVSVTLGFIVLYELCKETLFSRSELARVLFSFFRWTVAALLLAGALLSALLPQSTLERVVAVFQVLDLVSSLLRIGLLFALLAFTTALNISWKSLPAGVALGFGVWSCAEMAGSSLLSILGKRGYLTIDLVRMGAFNVCVLIWLIYIFRREKTPKFTGTALQLSELELLDQQMQRMLRP